MSPFKRTKTKQQNPHMILSAFLIMIKIVGQEKEKLIVSNTLLKRTKPN